MNADQYLQDTQNIFTTFADNFIFYRSERNISADELLAVAKAEMAQEYPDQELRHLEFGVADVAWGAPPVVSVYTGNTAFDPWS